jgi:hypothetical protein
MPTKLCFGFLSFMITSSPVWAYQCDTNTRPLSTPIDRFDNNQDGTLTDIDTGLTWMRCSLGQNWNGSACFGDAKSYTWSAAKEQIKINNSGSGFANHNDWRLPRLPELAGIIERECKDPRINLTLFPNAPALPFWSASVKKGNDKMAYALSFGNEGVLVLNKETTHLIRLVRGRN